jgi:hypothetical protein
VAAALVIASGKKINDATVPVHRQRLVMPIA